MQEQENEKKKKKVQTQLQEAEEKRCQIPKLNVTATERSIYQWASQQLRQKGKHVTSSNQRVRQAFLI